MVNWKVDHQQKLGYITKEDADDMVTLHTIREGGIIISSQMAASKGKALEKGKVGIQAKRKGKSLLSTQSGAITINEPRQSVLSPQLTSDSDPEEVPLSPTEQVGGQLHEGGPSKSLGASSNELNVIEQPSGDLKGKGKRKTGKAIRR